MSAIFVLIILSLLIALGFLAWFIWAMKDGQYEDDYTPAMRMLWDNPAPSSTQSSYVSNPVETGSESDDQAAD
ncbi:MAG: cbb3-type cytochrome oxidase assembly protein CcoS [Bacteroidota bacterium]